MSGSVETGRMLAVIGPSGAGKTTLLNMLRLKPGPGTANGAITLNGVPFSGALAKEHSAAVEQGASVWPMLTAREQLTYTFELVRPALSAADRRAAIDEMLDSLGLLEVQNTKAGSGLSGGELRRLAVATGLAKRPSLLFLDEPTTGLDSAAAAGVMDVVSQLATMANTAVICVIHQPSEAIYSKFDKVRPAARTSRALPCPPPAHSAATTAWPPLCAHVPHVPHVGTFMWPAHLDATHSPPPRAVPDSQVMLLSCGRTAYSGPANGIKPYFKTVGRPFPMGMSISEAALSITNRAFAADPTDVDKVLDAWAAQEKLPDVSVSTVAKKPESASLMGQLMTLTDRGVLHFNRDKTNWVGRVGSHVIIQLLLAAFVRGGDMSQASVQMKNGGVIVLLMAAAILPAVNIPFYDREMSLTATEVREGKVNPFVYVFASGVVQLPAICITAVVSGEPVPASDTRAQGEGRASL